jgi:hypothetical protein
MGSNASGFGSARAYRVDDRPELLRLLRCMYQDMHDVYGGVAPALDLSRRWLADDYLRVFPAPAGGTRLRDTSSGW